MGKRQEGARKALLAAADYLERMQRIGNTPLEQLTDAEWTEYSDFIDKWGNERNGQPDWNVVGFLRHWADAHKDQQEAGA